MSSRTIVAVGGSGTHAAIAFLRLAILSNMEIGQVPNLIVIDADVTPGVREGETIAPSLLETARKLHTQVVDGCKENSRPFFRHFPPYVGDGQQVQFDTPFGDYLIGQKVSTARPEDRLILDSLFTRPRGDGHKSEQEILISRGFYARPSVGATAVYDFLNQPQSALKKILAEQLGTVQGAIAVVGSSTGGTGSGSGPAIAQWLMAERRQKKSPARIGLFMTLPWFDSRTSEDMGEKEASYGNEGTQRLNAAAGVRFYAESPSLAGAGVFLADFNGHWHERNDDGNYGQPEYPHVFNLMISSQIQNFFLASERGDNVGVVGTYTFFHPTVGGNSKLEIRAADSALIAFSADKNQRQDIEDWANETQSIRLVLQHLATFVENDYRVGGGEPQDRQPQFASLMLNLARAIGPDNKTTEMIRGFLGLGKRLRESGEIRAALAKSLRNRAQALSDTIAWLYELWRNSVETDTGSERFSIDSHSVQVNLDSDPRIHEYFPIFKKRGDPVKTILDLFEDAFDESKTRTSSHPASSVPQNFEYLLDPKGGSMRPLEAATDVIETQIRALIQKEFGRSDRRAKDHATWVAGQNNATPLLPMLLRVNAVNHYLASFDIAQLVDEGDVRDGARKKPSDPTHPFTVSGLASANIPSPWAAAKLQSWTQMYGSAEKRNSAVHDFEAIMWGLFTKQFSPRSISLKEGRLANLLRVSLDAEMNSQELRNLASLLVLCDANEPADVVAVNHPLVGWFVAPWLAEEASAQKMDWWRLPRFNLQLPSDLVQNAESAFLTVRQVRSFVDALGILAATHQPDANSRRDIYWHVAVLDLIHRLQPAVGNVEAIPVNIVQGHKLCLLARQGTDAKEDHRIFFAELWELALSERDILKEYLPDYLVLLENKNLICPDSPILPQHIGAVSAIYKGMEREGADEDYTYRVSYDLTIAGLGTLAVTLPARMEKFKTHVEMWPNFKEAGWKYYYLGCDAGRTIEALDNVRFSLYDQSGNVLGRKVHRSFRTNHEFEGVPAFLGIEIKEKDIYVSRGLFEIKLDEVKGATKVFQMGLDIGTSHSCIYGQNGQGNRIPGLDFSRGAELRKPIFEYDEGRVRFENELGFLGMFAARLQDNNQSVIPSELRVQKRPSVPIGTDMLNDEPDPGKHFTTTPQAFLTNAGASRASGDEILSDFKWSVQRHWMGKISHGLADTPFAGSQERVLRVYLRQFLRIGLALLRKQGYKRLEVFRATYPEAFDDIFIRNYAKLLAELLQELPACTGMEIGTNKQITQEYLLSYRANPASGATGQDSFMLSESLAAIGAANDGVGSPLWVPGVCLVLDMGGGSTDVALYVTAQRGDDPVQVASLTDSIRYAGNDVLGLLAIPAVLRVLLHAMDPTVTDVDINRMDDAQRIIMLKRAMRDERATHALRIAMANGDIAPELSSAITLFFQGIMDYSSLALKPYLKKFETETRKVTVSVILLGNGWYLSDLVWHQGNVPAGGFMDEFKRELTRQVGGLGCVELKYQTAGGQTSVKESVAMGAVNFVPGGTLVARMNPTLSVPGFPLEINIGGVRKSIAEGDFLDISCKPKQLVNAIEIGSIDVLPEDMRRNLAEMLGVDEADLPDRVKMILKANMEQFINLRLHGNDPIRISPLAMFLEGLWKNVVLRVGKGNSN